MELLTQKSWPLTPAPLALLALSGLRCDGCGDKGETGAPGQVSATVLTDADEGIGGPLAGERAGDVLLQNDRIRVVLQKPGRALALNPYGGNIIDADVVREGDGRDRFGEVGLFINTTITCAPESMDILEDGSAGPAQVRFQGPAARSDYINAQVMMLPP